MLFSHRLTSQNQVTLVVSYTVKEEQLLSFSTNMHADTHIPGNSLAMGRWGKPLNVASPYTRLSHGVGTHWLRLVHNYDACASVPSIGVTLEQTWFPFQCCVASVSQHLTNQTVKKFNIRNRIWLVKLVFLWCSWHQHHIVNQPLLGQYEILQYQKVLHCGFEQEKI